MKTRHILPDKRIASFVDRILVIEKSQIITPFILPLYPNGVPTILFKSVKGKIGDKKVGHLTLFGQTVSPEFLSLSDDFVLIAYFFKPYTLMSLFGIQANEITDKPVDLNLILAGRSKIPEERLLNANDVDVMIKLLDDFIFGLLSTQKTECELMKVASIEIAENPTKEALIRVQQKLHITERTFQRMFEKNIGIAPNLYRRICQFNSAFNLLNDQRWRQKLTDIAYENGYADQSHYTRSFKEFTGITPTEYLRFGS